MVLPGADIDGACGGIRFNSSLHDGVGWVESSIDNKYDMLDSSMLYRIAVERKRNKLIVDHERR